MKRLQALVCAALLLTAPAHAGSAKSEASQQFTFGVRMAQKGSWREAAFRFERAVRTDPNNPFAHNNLGVALESVGDFDKALASYKRALELDPDNTKVSENMERLEAYLAGRNAPARPPSQAKAPGASAAEPPPEPAPPPESKPKPGGGNNAP